MAVLKSDTYYKGKIYDKGTKVGGKFKQWAEDNDFLVKEVIEMPLKQTATDENDASNDADAINVQTDAEDDEVETQTDGEIETEGDDGETDAVDFGEMTNNQIKEYIAEHGGKYGDRDNKATLVGIASGLAA